VLAPIKETTVTGHNAALVSSGAAEPGLCRVWAGSEPGLSRVWAGSVPGLSRVWAGSHGPGPQFNPIVARRRSREDLYYLRNDGSEPCRPPSSWWRARASDPWCLAGRGSRVGEGFFFIMVAKTGKDIGGGCVSVLRVLKRTYSHRKSKNSYFDSFDKANKNTEYVWHTHTHTHTSVTMDTKSSLSLRPTQTQQRVFRRPPCGR